METFATTPKRKICIIIAGILFFLVLALGGYGIWFAQQPKFHDLTVELGTNTISLRDFMTDKANARKVSFISDPAIVDLNKVGQIQLTLKHGRRQEDVVLTIQDTVAPTANIQKYCYIFVDQIPQAAELVSNVVDMSAVKVYYRTEPKIPLDYSDFIVEVVVEDTYGNEMSQLCVMVCQWLPEVFHLELGQTLTKETLLTNDERDVNLLDQTQIDLINASGIGEYTVTGTIGDTTRDCTVIVQDTLGPELELQEVKRYPGNAVELEDFLVSVSDYSEVADTRLVSELDVSTEGKYEVTIEAEDVYGNVTTKQTTLYVATDLNAPRLYGNFNTLKVDKYSQPDFLNGFWAHDSRDGNCEVVCDTSNLDLTKAGTYYITYSTMDVSGNKTEQRRKVVVNHDEEDTLALVKEYAAQFSDDPEEMRQFVQKKIYYSTDWGGEDPVWHGLTAKHGNCYVHALVLQALLEEKGYETQLIWVTDWSHYWLIVNLDGVWRHIDGTPGRWHQIYTIMTDEQRLATLRGRVWDKTQWPACE